MNMQILAEITVNIMWRFAGSVAHAIAFLMQPSHTSGGSSNKLEISRFNLAEDSAQLKLGIS